MTGWYEFPVSPAQARLLVAEQLNPGSGQYYVPFGFRVRGRFDRAAFGRAVDALVARHEALRTVFRYQADAQVQLVAPPGGDSVLRVAPEVPAAEAEARMRADAAAPFDLTGGPLLRVVVYPVTDGSHRILLAAHHLVCDGWSVQILLRELAADYRAELSGERHERAGRPAYERGDCTDPPPLSIQYPDFAAWQAERLAAGGYAAAIGYWADRLRDAPASTALPADRPRSAVRSASGGMIRVALPKETRDRLAAVARPRRATPFLALLAGYAAFLGRICGQDDLVIGVPVAARDRADLQDVVGLVTNTVAVRVDLSGDPTFHQVIDRVRDWMVAGVPHQEAPFDAVVDAVAGVREATRDPLVQVMFGYDESELALELPDAEVDRVEVLLDAALVDLLLYVENAGPDELAAYLNYRAELFERATVAGWATAFETLLAGLLAAPAAPVSTVEALGAGERRRVLAAGDRTAAAAPPEERVTDLVAQRAADRPDATALACGEVRLSYRELLAHADTLAARLVAAGVGPDVPVGLLLPHGPGLPVAALGVLRAGGCYVPLDPADPPVRLRHLAAAAGVRCVVAETGAAAAQTPDLPVVAPPAVTGPPPEDPPPVPGRPRSPADLAYVMFTSGSTGAPKPVAVEHRAVTNVVAAIRGELGMTDEDRVLQFFSFGFDASVLGLLASWAAGAEQHLAMEHERLGEPLRERLVGSRITYVLMTPVAAMTLPVDATMDDLRTVLVGGEAVPDELVPRLAAPGRRLLNAYGPTEATVLITTGPLRPGEPVTIGRAIAGTRVYVLDGRLRVVPTGVVGEIYLAGEQLARGYPGLPGLTAARFVADPYGPPGSRMYRTGDLGRFDGDGRLHCLGRTDGQVKIRGFRVELGEIEAALASHQDVAVAAAAAHGTGADRRLVGYVVGAGGRPPTAGALRSHLAERLSGYLVPEAIVALDALPLNRRGKVDRAKLPEPAAGRPELERPYRAPATDRQRRVAAVWAEVLGQPRVGAEDGFFELGGNSVRLLRVLAALRQDGGAAGALELVDLFRHPTVTSLAAHLDRLAEEAADGDPVSAARRRGAERRALLAAASRRLRTPPEEPR